MNQPWVYMCPPTPTPRPEPLSDLPPHSILLGCLSVLALSALFHALNLDWSSVSHMVIYMFQLMQLSTRKIIDPIKKMGQRTKQTFLQRRYTDD